MKIDLDHIERVARAAKWRLGRGWMLSDVDDGSHAVLCAGCCVAEATSAEIAEHIAACSPDVVLALVAKLRSAESAIRYLWDAWSDAEGEGQPEVYAFGDPELDEYLRAQGEEAERAPADVQEAIREARGK